MKPNQIIKSNEASTKTLILQIIQILPSMHACMHAGSQDTCTHLSGNALVKELEKLFSVILSSD